MNTRLLVFALTLIVGTGNVTLWNPALARPILEHLTAGTIVVALGWILKELLRSSNDPPSREPPH